MAKEDILLRVEMGKLEIEPSKVNKNVKILNLSQQKRICTTKNVHQNYKCTCLSHRKNKSMAICKKKHRILKEPVLKLSQCYNKTEYQSLINKDKKHTLCPHKCIDSLSLHDLVDDCNQLSISSDDQTKNSEITEPTNDTTEWWRGNISHDKQSKDFS